MYVCTLNREILEKTNFFTEIDSIKTGNLQTK